MWTILFDIDGTLLRTRGAGLKAIQVTMQQMFGISEIPQVTVHGRTDHGILGDVFDAHDLSLADHLPEFLDTYTKHLESLIHQYEGQLLPGVTELLADLDQREDFAIGLLTGNCRRAAEIKIDHFGLGKYFQPFGGFGDQTSDRNEVAKIARQSAEQFLKHDFRPEKVWVVGDTINDIHCGRAIGANVLAVETGGCQREELQNANPDHCLADLTDRHQVISVLSSGIG